MRALLAGVFICIIASVCAQNLDLPSDFLPKSFFAERRAKLIEKLPANSVAVFFSNAMHTRAADVSFKFHQDPDFYYLTGYKETNSVLLIFKDKQVNPAGGTYNEIIFVQPRNPEREMWSGRRLGDAGVREQLGLALSFNNSEFKSYNIDFSKFDQVLFYDFKNDVRDQASDSSDLFNLIQQFKVKAHYPDKAGLSLATEPQKNNLNTKDLSPIMAQLRVIKSPEEMKLLRKAINISCQSQIEVMKAVKPGMSEMEIQGIHEYVFKKYQAEDVGYPSIVGSGHNGCILHYEENYKPMIDSKDLLLMDLGAEYHGYTADITRTIPISGKFSPQQKQIYELVLKAQEDAMKLCKPGATFADLNNATKATINKGLADLKIIASEQESHNYYPHGCCHFIGLDVHDKGPRKAFEEGMTFTVEPGIYIPEGSKCDKQWWGIAVRIEDDVLITKDGFELLSKLAPRTVKDIEETMKLPSPLDQMSLPNFDSK